MLKNKKFITIIIITLIFIVHQIAKKQEISKSHQILAYASRWCNKDIANPVYQKTCIDLYKNMRFPNMSLFFKPALKEPPPNLLDEFTMNGKMPIKRWLYYNQIYSDSKGIQQ